MTLHELIAQAKVRSARSFIVGKMTDHEKRNVEFWCETVAALEELAEMKRNVATVTPTT